jgi:hypothetical protein
MPPAGAEGKGAIHAADWLQFSGEGCESEYVSGGSGPLTLSDPWICCGCGGVGGCGCHGCDGPSHGPYGHTAHKKGDMRTND